MSDTYFKAISVLGCGISSVTCRGQCKHDCCDGENCVTWLEGKFRTLAAYEDTGLNPEEIKAAFAGVSPDRLRELAEADRDGRCVILPCKVGSAAYSIDSDCKENPDPTRMCFCWDKSCKDCDKSYLRVWENRTETASVQSVVSAMYGQKSGFGKTVFLTRAEAEAALAERRKP